MCLVGAQHNPVFPHPASSSAFWDMFFICSDHLAFSPFISSSINRPTGEMPFKLYHLPGYSENNSEHGAVKRWLHAVQVCLSGTAGRHRMTVRIVALSGQVSIQSFV